jgi:DNA-binding PadR family transcriptional regulator
MTNAELAVLSLVVERPRHGYDIERLIVQRGMRGWTDIGFSSIYYLLGKLEKAGLVEARAAEPVPGVAEAGAGSAAAVGADAAGSGRAARGPARKVYAPTPAGFSAWQEASLEALSVPAMSSPFSLGLSNIVGLPAGDVLDALREYRAQMDERLAGMRAKRDSQEPLEWFVAELFDYSDAMMEAEIGWVEGLLGRLEKRGEVAAMPKLKVNVPVIVEKPDATMAVVHTVGDPTDVGQKAFPAIYGAAYGLKFALKKSGGPEFKVTAPRARWFGGPDWALQPRSEWKAAWAIEIPEGTAEVVQKDPETPVVIERWEYGTVAEVLHIGTYADETPTIELLHAFIAEQGYEIVGPHEEEYQSRPDAKNPKTVIRYQVAKRAG